MASLPIRWIVARTYCQATEEESRVIRALDSTLPLGETSRKAVEGQYGNPVIVLARRAVDAADLRAVWKRWSQAGLVEAVRPTLRERVDDDAILHVRVDKQQAFEGTLALARGADMIDVQVKLKAYPARPEEIRRVAESLVSGGI